MEKLNSILLFAILFSSCNNFNPPPEDHRGSIQFVNTSDDPYSIYINKSLKKVLPANKSVTYKLPAGDYLCEEKQESGYLLIPTTRKNMIALGDDDNQIVTFP